MAFDHHNKKDWVHRKASPDAEGCARDPTVARLVSILVTEHLLLIAFEFLPLSKAFGVAECQSARLDEIVRMCDPIQPERGNPRMVLEANNRIKPGVIHAMQLLIAEPSRSRKPDINGKNRYPCKKLSGGSKSNIPARRKGVFGRKGRGQSNAVGIDHDYDDKEVGWRQISSLGPDEIDG
jgi:hypothetical protein